MTGRRLAVAAAACGAAVAMHAPPGAAAPTIVAPSVSGGGRADGVARFVLILGVNHGVDPGLPVLRYADDDAVQYADLFRALGGKIELLTRIDPDTRRVVAPEAVALARAPRRAELTRAVAALASDVAAARVRGQRTMLYFVYAGHGNVDGKDAYLALEDRRLDSNNIEHEIIDKVRADESHLIIDACYSYLVVRGPGGRRRDVPDFVKLGLSRRSDVGLLLSTTATHESHEWVGFQAGIFSHEVRSGLYGAADLDGDGRITYLEIASFVRRANEAIPNERFRPEIYEKPPVSAAQLIDLRGVSGRRLRLDATAKDDHYLLEDGLGRRLADFHNASGHELRMLLPSGGQDLYLKRVGVNETEFAIPATPDMVSLADLSPQEPRFTSKGAVDQAFRLIFSLPFDEQAIAEYVQNAPGADVVEVSRDEAGPMPFWREAAATAAFGVAVAAGAGAVSFRSSALDAQHQANNPLLSGRDTAALNDRMVNRRHLAELSIGVASAALLTGFWLVFAPRAPVHPAGALDSRSGTLGLAGNF